MPNTPKVLTGATKLPSLRSRRPSVFAIITLAAMWVLLYGDLSWGNVLAGGFLAGVVTWFAPMPRTNTRRFVVRPIALVQLIGVFLWEVLVASVQISRVIITGRRPVEAIIRVQTRAHSDAFLAATSGFVTLVPGSIVVDAHRLTGMMYVHLFDAPDAAALQSAHDGVLRQEERLLRALGTRQDLIEAGYVPGGSMKLGRLPKADDKEAS